jgi:hypothetical protein
MTGRGEAQGTRTLRLETIKNGELLWEATVSELAGLEGDKTWHGSNLKRKGRYLRILRLGLCSGT